MNDRPLTPRQKQILTFISVYIGRHGFAPSMREICHGVHVHSTSTVAHQLNVLEARGWIRRGGFNQPRALALTDRKSA